MCMKFTNVPEILDLVQESYMLVFEKLTCSTTTSRLYPSSDSACAYWSLIPRLNTLFNNERPVLTYTSGPLIEKLQQQYPNYEIRHHLYTLHSSVSITNEIGSDDHTSCEKQGHDNQSNY